MQLQLENSVTAITVFVQGLLSFFSPCVLPLIPLYIGYLSGGGKTMGENGEIHYKRGIILRNTAFFVIGISFAFGLLGLGFSALGRFFTGNQMLFARIGGIIVILFGLYQLGLFGSSMTLSQERRLPLNLDKLAMNPLTALLLGFVFSFAWTPCVGPVLGSVLLMAASATSQMAGFALVGVYTLGFILPFLAVGFFTGSLLTYFQKHQNVVRYTVKIGGVLMVLMGIMMITGWMNNITGYLNSVSLPSAAPTVESTPAPENANVPMATQTPSAPSPTPEPESVPAPDFTLTDQNGDMHTLSDYKGKTVFLNFWATWCPPCRAEMPDIQALYEDWGENEGELVVLGVAGPNVGQEGSAESIAAFLAENGYTYPVAMDETGDAFIEYGISAFPTTFMIDEEGNVFGYVPGGLSRANMDNIVKQTMDGGAAG